MNRCSIHNAINSCDELIKHIRYINLYITYKMFCFHGHTAHYQRVNRIRGNKMKTSITIMNDAFCE